MLQKYLELWKTTSTSKSVVIIIGFSYFFFDLSLNPDARGFFSLLNKIGLRKIAQLITLVD